MSEAGLTRWLGVAMVVHAAALAGAVKGYPRRPSRASLEPAMTLINVVAEPAAAIAKAPEPTAAVPARLAEAPPTSPKTVAARQAPKQAAPGPASTTPDVRPPSPSQLAVALSALVAQATKILASTEGNGPPIASGNADSAYGMVAGDGTGTAPTFDARAGLRGRPGGTTPPPVREPPDRSRHAAVNTGYNLDCAFPTEADRDRIDHGWAQLIVTVRADGSAARVQLLGDSGHGFGRVAQQCSMRARYLPALDRRGTPIEQDTPSFRYGFHR